MTTEKTTEPLWWGLFSAGGVVAAFLVPIHIVLVGFALPLGWISDSGALPLYHWGHRHYFTLNHMGLKPMSSLLAVLCYGGAIVGTVVTAWVLLKV